MGIRPVYARQILQKLSLIPITSWNLKSQDSSIRHIGPVTQDFYTAFVVGEDDRHITTGDADGVALAPFRDCTRRSKRKTHKLPT